MSAPSDPGPERRVGALDLPPDTPPDVVALLSAAAGPATEDELAGETAAVAAFLAQRAEQPDSPRPLPVRALRVAAGALIAIVVLGGGLAAADVLPTPAQRWVSRTLGSVGIDVPSPDQPPSDAPGVGPTQKEQLPLPAPADLPVGNPGISQRVPTTGGPSGPPPGPAAVPAGPAAGNASADGPAAGGTGATTGTSVGSDDGNDSGSATDTDGSSASETAGSKAKDYGSGGNPAHGNNQARQPASSPASPAHGKRNTAPGQLKQQTAQTPEASTG